MPLSDDALPENSHIVHPAFLEKHSSKKDLVRRLRKLTQVLAKDESIEHDSPEWPGLAATAAVLVDKFLSHKDKEVRLYAVLSCMEIFAIYAPHAPWDEEEILKIFRQTIRQLANLGHTTAAPQANFANYGRILDLLAHVRIGTVLVDLAQNEHDEADEQALDVLVDLVHTLIHAVRNEHPPEILELVVTTIRVCLDEYNYKVPTKILDEILLCIGQGPTMTVLQASKTSKAPLQKQVPNPSYMAAAAIVRKTHNKTATPIATMLNGLLNGDTHIVEQSSLHVDHTIEEGSVWNIIYQLHKVAPQILTTVIGTVSNGLESTEADRRLAVTQLLGKLFATNNMASQFHPCFSMWLRRHQDIEVSIRKCTVAALVKMVPVVQNEMQQEAVDALKHLTTTDPNVDVRIDAIHQICDLIYRHKESHQIPAALLQAVGARVSAKHKQERRDALTGLAKIYHRHCVLSKLKDVQAGGDDCDLKVILGVLHDACHLDRRRRRKGGRRQQLHDDDDHLDVDEEKYRWIPRKVLESACFTDQTDTEMRSRVVHIVDEILLGTSTKSDKNMSATARAVGLAMILDSLREDGENVFGDGGSSNAFKFLQQLLGQRASLQKMVCSYIDARARVRQCEPGTEEALAADAKAMELLEILATLTAPVLDSKMSQADVLEAFHSARDKHIFRILATVANPAHTMQARSRALDELPKRTKSLGDAVSVWVKNLVRRCAMGDFINVDVVSHCVLLAQECFFENDIPACASLLACVKTASTTFPSLCATKKTFVTLTELFSECRSVSDSEKKKEIEESGIVTALSSILSAAAPNMTSSSKSKDSATYFSEDDFQSQLFQLSTRDGTPEQARNAVYTLARLLQPSDQGTSSQSEQAVMESFDPLLKALTSATRLSISSSRKDSSKVVSALSALAAFSDCAPRVFNASDRSDKAIKFALETILMGRGHTEESSDTESSDEEQEAISPTGKTKPRSASKKKDSLKHLSPEATASLLEDENLSIACRRACAAIDFLVSHVRASILFSLQKGRKEGPSRTPQASERVRQMFELLSQILRDKGLPPSNRDRRECKSRQDRAALRQCAAVHLLRLCDARLGLEKKFLSPAMWHIFSESFLDEERTVREAAMDELSSFLKGSGIYGIEGSKVAAKAPSLRFAALLALCTDGDHGMDHDPANGNAANVGKLSNPTKAAALQCIMNLRKVCDVTYTQCKAMGRDAEKKFDSQFKMLVMPEYVVPYAIHLLSHRRETPSAGAAPTAGNTGSEGSDDDDDSSALVSDESLHRVLRKRLKWLFEPLVQSLGDSADNISFLIRMTEILGRQFKPVDVLYGLNQEKGSPLRLSIDSESGKPNIDNNDGKRSKLLEAKLKTICVAAREVLLSFVKKDVNLSTYPGIIQLPSSLFRKKAPTSRSLSRANLSRANNTYSHSVGSSQNSEEASLSQKQHKSSAAKASSLQTSSQESMDLTPPVEETSPKRKFLRSSQTSSQQSKDSLSQPSIEDTSPMLENSPIGKSLRSSRSLSRPRRESTSDEVGAGRKKKTLRSSQSPLQQGKGPSSPKARASALKKSLDSNQKSRVHFSPDVLRTFSPIARSSSDAVTLGSTPPSTLRGATIHSEAHEGSTDGESPATSKSSPIIKEDPLENTNSPDDGFSHEDDDGIKTTSETQSTQQSEQASKRLSRRSRRKRKTSTQESTESERNEPESKRKSKIPTQIKVNRPKLALRASEIEPLPKKRRSSQSDRLDFDFPDEEENQPAGRNRPKKAPKKGKHTIKKTKVIAENPVSSSQGSTSSRALRSRRH